MPIDELKELGLKLKAARKEAESCPKRKRLDAARTLGHQPCFHKADRKY